MIAISLDWLVHLILHGTYLVPWNSRVLSVALEAFWCVSLLYVVLATFMALRRRAKDACWCLADAAAFQALIIWLVWLFPAVVKHI